ncbi:DNA replication/repair protein RecF [Megasphaera coli]|uniref:DNA replication/repair protein RecF n=1 Tax=Colibacter massiliensis TaxID=1852379 RepID=UPI00094E24F3|nr:DNA replication/repair protein RecF [Colibacter massiliensis]
MIITRLRLQGFRNYEHADITFPPAIVVLYGNNGEGKTNLLESLYTGCMGRSYRGAADTDMLRQCDEKGSVIINFFRNNVEQQVKIILSRSEKKSTYINETKVKIRELFGTLQEVLFSPDDIQLIKGNPSLRRRFMDMEISQVSPSYYKTLLQYNRVVTQRNLLLKKMKYEGSLSLEEWDRQIAFFAAEIVKKRLESLQKINFMAHVIYKRLTGGKDSLSLAYVQPYEKKGEDFDDKINPDRYYQLLQNNLKNDIYRASTSIGPHRDDLFFNSSIGSLKRFGSQGQQRTAVLALKMAELEFVKSEQGEYPVLLLDDVMSELDEERRNALLDFVHARIQTFITTTDAYLFQNEKECSLFKVMDGTLTYE